MKYRHFGSYEAALKNVTSPIREAYIIKLKVGFHVIIKVEQLLSLYKKEQGTMGLEHRDGLRRLQPPPPPTSYQAKKNPKSVPSATPI